VTLTSIAHLDRLRAAEIEQYKMRASGLFGHWKQWREWDIANNGNRDVLIQLRNSKHRLPGVHASEISKCQRMVAYSMKGLSKVSKTSVKSQGFFDLGHCVHGIIQYEWYEVCKWLGGDQLRFVDEANISPKLGGLAARYNIFSHSDGVFTFVHGGVPYLRAGLEIKTMAPDEYKGLSAPKEDHIEQCHVYMATLDIPFYWLMYVNKSNMQRTESKGAFLIQWNPLIWQKIEQTIISTEQIVSSGAMPERTESYGCTTCAYSWSCVPEYLAKYKERD
jgi:CRISPR/Cas system-associated exonuclease Cas4 (RecB family)